MAPGLTDLGELLWGFVGFPSGSQGDGSARHLKQPRPKQEGWRQTSPISLAATWSHDHLPVGRWQDSDDCEWGRPIGVHCPDWRLPSRSGSQPDARTEFRVCRPESKKGGDAPTEATGRVGTAAR